QLAGSIGTLYNQARSLLKDVFYQVAKVLKIAPIVVYFGMWSFKTNIRHKLKTTSLGILSLSGIFLTIEVVMEWTGAKRLHDLMVTFEGKLAFVLPSFASSHNIFRLLFVGAVAYLIWHHVSERWKVGYEYRFVKQVNSFMLSSSSYHNEEDLVRAALPKFLVVFKESRVVRCSIFKVDGEGEKLFIPNSHISPSINDNSYEVRLKPGEGVAGTVFAETRPLYVPRLFFPFAKRWRWTPSMYFPHAVGFDFLETDGELELVNDQLKLKVFVLTAPKPPFRATLSVPLISRTNQACLGVLNFDFAKHDPLDRSEIAMASILGLLLGDEMARLSLTNGSDPEVVGK
ncbi:MAG TPA: hypothetical protein VN843_15595, partial [Anaerolineales bacterium]|nr:hypothetical protein [Anaerolineales bacterium]